MRTVENLRTWTFAQEGRAPAEVEVPHDWAIYGPFDRENDNQKTRILEDGEEIVTEHPGRTGALPHVGKGRYTCKIAGPSAPGRRVYLDFDGVMSHARVSVNGTLAGVRNYGYSSFRVDATRHLHEGENEVEVTAENLSASARWYPGAGLYRPVHRVETDPVHFAHWSLHLKYLPQSNRLLIEGEIRNHTGKEQSGKVTVSSPLFDTVSWDCTIPPVSGGFARTVALKEHEKWDVDHPVLYPVTFQADSGTWNDAETIRYGIREFHFDAEQGFLLNGRRLKLNGVCMHHDLGPIGAAFNTAAARRQLEILRSMGCNAIRTSHNPPAPQLLDLCDRMGFLVMNEAFDSWIVGKTENDYHLHFPKDSDTDLRDLILRDRNHPCVILWSIGNEIREDKEHWNGPEIAAHLAELVRSIDTERPVSIGRDLNPKELDRAEAWCRPVDVPGWNYQPQLYPEFRRRFPDRAMIGSETLSTVSSRGVYHFPAREYEYYWDKEADAAKARQCSGYDLEIPPWATIPESEFAMQEACDYVAGQFIWTGFDYLGEPTPYKWPSRSSYFGCIDLVGLPKDLYYCMKALWQPAGEPMTHIVPHHWNWAGHETLDVHVFSNCDEAELFLNGRSLGKQHRHIKSAEIYKRYRLIWQDVRWEPGELKVIGFRQGKACTEEILCTAGTPAKLHLETGRTVCNADGEDMLFITVSVLDEQGVPCPLADDLIHFELAGESLKLMAADGGDPTSQEPFYTPQCRLFSGMAVVYLKSTGKSGGTVLKASGTGLTAAELTLSAAFPACRDNGNRPL